MEQSLESETKSHGRDSEGRFTAGHSYGKRFEPGNNLSKGRYWFPAELRKQAQDNAPHAVGALLAIIDDPKRHIAYRIQAIDILLNYGFGAPELSALVKYEIDNILSRLGLPNRSHLRDNNGDRIFGAHGGYIPSQQADKAINSQPLDESQYADEVFRRLFPRVNIGNADYRQQARKAIQHQWAECEHLKAELVQLASCYKRLQEHYEQELAILEDMQMELGKMPPADD